MKPDYIAKARKQGALSQPFIALLAAKAGDEHNVKSRGRFLATHAPGTFRLQRNPHAYAQYRRNGGASRG